MRADAVFIMAIMVGIIGLAISLWLEKKLVPCPRFDRPLPVWGLHIALVAIIYGVLLLLLARPLCAMTGVLAIIATVVLVNNAKYKSLREPFIYQDYDYFIDTIRFPRLFLPFLGVKAFCLAALGFVIALGAVWLEPAWPRFDQHGLLAAVLSLFVFSALLLLLHKIWPVCVTFKAEQDYTSFGLLASIFAYGVEARECPRLANPYKAVRFASKRPLPHLVAVQSESFFDPRPLYCGIKQNVLGNFDKACQEAVLHGQLTVPAWGANTVRTEFAFLSGIAPEALGVHQFQPYKLFGRCCLPPALPMLLMAQGYRTICIHPHNAEFYDRDWVMPKLGFETFLDKRHFVHARHDGPYIADDEVCNCIARILDEAKEPTFIFAITMENHGPLHLEKATASDVNNLYDTQPPSDCDELTVYLRHIRNADSMVARLKATMNALAVPASLCWYGDHVPIMPRAYSVFHKPSGLVPYFCWANRSARMNMEIGASAKDIQAHELGLEWISGLEIIEKNTDLVWKM